MANTKFIETLEKYAKKLGLTEAVSGSTTVMTPPSNSNPSNPGLDKLSIDELAKQEADSLKTTHDILDRITKGLATPEDYNALSKASTDLNNIQQTKTKLNTTSTNPGTIATSTTNPLDKPLV